MRCFLKNISDNIRIYKNLLVIFIQYIYTEHHPELYSKGDWIVNNYEAFYAALLPLEKALKDSANGIVNMQKKISKNTETGNLTDARKLAAGLSESIDKLRDSADALTAHLDSLDIQAYFADGDFTRQLLEACARRNIDVRGEKGVYEMFPLKVRVLGDGEHAAEVWLNRRKLPSFRPEYVADAIQAVQTKLYAGSFKAASFMNELADAYETACLKTGARIGSTQALNKIYKYMAPTARARKDYDAQMFAFDLARLYEAGTEAWVTRGGVRYAFGTSRDGASGIRVLSRSGVESYINTLRPLNEAED